MSWVEEQFERVESVLPIDCFSLSVEIPYAKAMPKKGLIGKSFLLPDTSKFLDETHFADVGLAWNEEGLMAEVLFHKPFEESNFPRFEEGESVEFFIDTRDLKTAGFMTRFCHHFVFLPQSEQGTLGYEISRFRSEDSHPLCNPDDLQVIADLGRTEISMKIVIPQQCLHGYDPANFPRLGFTYKIHRKGGVPQHFACSSAMYAIDHHPSLWASLRLTQ
jgi:hypothetical protein